MYASSHEFHVKMIELVEPDLALGKAAECLNFPTHGTERSKSVEELVANSCVTFTDVVGKASTLECAFFDLRVRSPDR